VKTLTDAFALSADRHGDDRIALIDGANNHYSFYDLKYAADIYAAGWHARGVRAGDRVLIAMGIGFELYASLAALWSLGAIVVLPEPAMGLQGIKTAVASTKPKFFCSDGGYKYIKWIVPALWNVRLLLPRHRRDGPVPNVDDPNAVALISFTSGTTGHPKAIPRTHAFLMAQWAAVAPLLATDEEVIDLVTFPVFVLINLAEGRTSVLPNWKMSKLGDLDPQVLADWIGNTGCTRALLPPALCEKLLDAGDVAGLRHVFTGGGPVFPDVVARLQGLSDTLSITSVYGSTEAEPIAHLDAASVSAADQDAMALGQGLLAGHPVDVVRVRIKDDEIQVAGEHVNKGYLNPDQDADTKIIDDDTVWHRTGDAGRFDDVGRLWLLGRIGDRVAQQGDWLYPFAIETSARLWPGVARAALVQIAGRAVLAVEGDATQFQQWQNRAQRFGAVKVTHVAAIPLDRRHRSKVDAKALKALLKQQ